MPEFLAWQLNQRPLQTYFDRAAEGSVTKSVRRAVLGEARINIPPLEKQQQILALYKTLQKEKSLYADLIRNVCIPVQTCHPFQANLPPTEGVTI